MSTSSLTANLFGFNEFYRFFGPGEGWSTHGIKRLAINLLDAGRGLGRDVDMQMLALGLGDGRVDPRLLHVYKSTDSRDMRRLFIFEEVREHLFGRSPAKL